MGAANLHYAVKFLRLGRNRIAHGLDRRNQRVLHPLRRRDVHRRRNRAVRGLRHVEGIVRMPGVFDPLSPPEISMARFEMTSFTFMLVCVPEPVCQMRSGNWSFNLPAMTSSAACAISFAMSGESLPRS